MANSADCFPSFIPESNVTGVVALLSMEVGVPFMFPVEPSKLVLLKRLYHFPLEGRFSGVAVVGVPAMTLIEGNPETGLEARTGDIIFGPGDEGVEVDV